MAEMVWQLYQLNICYGRDIAALNIDFQTVAARMPFGQVLNVVLAVGTNFPCTLCWVVFT